MLGKIVQILLRNDRFFAICKPLHRLIEPPTKSSGKFQLIVSSPACSSPDAVVDDGFTVLRRHADPSVLQPRVVVYDGVCHLCHAGVKWIIGADKHRKIKFCCLQSKAAEPYLRVCDLDREAVLKRFLFVEGLYAYHQGSTAALKVVSYLPFPYSALSIFLVVPTPVRDFVYDYVAKRRYKWFGKENKCIIIPEEEALSRFIDRDELLENALNQDDQDSEKVKEDCDSGGV
ncbi:putative thiol-disulfide oxidoreductase DCC [Wolffia australiana]